MKNAIIALISVVILAATVTSIIIISGRSTRQTELDNGVNTAIEQTLENNMAKTMLGSGAGGADHEEFVADFIQNLAAQLNSDADITVKVLAVDTEKGLMDLEVTETFKHIIGTEGKVHCRRTVSYDEYGNEDAGYHTVLFMLDDLEVYSQLNVHHNSRFGKPKNPKKDGMVFVEWKLEGDPDWDGDFSKIKVTEDMTFTAVWNTAEPTLEVKNITAARNAQVNVREEMIVTAKDCAGNDARDSVVITNVSGVGTLDGDMFTYWWDGTTITLKFTLTDSNSGKTVSKTATFTTTA